MLEAAGVEVPVGVDGRSLLPLLAGESASVREIGIYGRHGDTVNVTDGRYTLFLHHPERHPGGSRMFDLRSDPRQATDVLAQQTDIARAFQAYAVRELEKRAQERCPWRRRAEGWSCERLPRIAICEEGSYQCLTWNIVHWEHRD
jgi:hypothetical protein